MRCVK